MMSGKRGRQLLVAAAVLAAVLPAAAATAAGAGSTARILRQVKALEAQTAAMAAELVALQDSAARLEERPSPSDPAPGGPAGGDLAGAYPNPIVGAGSASSATLLDGTLLGSDFKAGSVQSSNVLDGTLGSAAIANGGVGVSDLGASVVGGPQLGGVNTVRSPEGPFVPAGATSAASVSCPAGEQLLTAGFEWEWRVPQTGGGPGGGPGTGSPHGLEVTEALPSPIDPNTWFVSGKNDGDAKIEGRLNLTALCLQG